MTAVVAASLAISVVPVAHAEESVNVEVQEITPTQDEQTPETGDTEQGVSAVEIIAGVAVIAGVAAAIAGGVHWAVQQRMIPNPLPGIIPNPSAPKKAPAKKAVAKPAPAPKPATKPATAPAPAPAPKPATKPVYAPAPVSAPSASYRNCTDVWNKLGRSIYPSDNGFQSKFDRDGDGVGCESDPR